MTRWSALLLGNYGPSLAVARDLAGVGIRVIAGDGGEYSAVRWSRHCHETWRHPPIAREEELVAALVDHVGRREDITLLIPLRPDYVRLMALFRHRLPDRLVVASPDPETVLICLSKERTYELAAEAGVNHHRAVRVREVEQLREACREIGFPCIIRRNDDPAQLLPGHRKAVICADPSELDRSFPEWPAGMDDLLVQHYAPGPRYNVYFAAQAGRIVARIQTRAVRTDRLDGTGLTVDGVTVEPDPRIDRDCDRLVERLGYNGIGVAQFIMPTQGDPHFLELNPRHGGSYANVRRWGLDLTQAACDIARGRDVRALGPRSDYPVGKRYAWTSRDLFGLWTSVVGAEIDRSDALRWLARTLATAARADVHLTWSWWDPLPTLAVYGHLARQVLTGVRARGRTAPR